jgi:hypothetical protein
MLKDKTLKKGGRKASTRRVRPRVVKLRIRDWRSKAPVLEDI